MAPDEDSGAPVDDDSAELQTNPSGSAHDGLNVESNQLLTYQDPAVQRAIREHAHAVAASVDQVDDIETTDDRPSPGARLDRRLPPSAAPEAPDRGISPA